VFYPVSLEGKSRLHEQCIVSILLPYFNARDLLRVRVNKSYLSGEHAREWGLVNILFSRLRCIVRITFNLQVGIFKFPLWVAMRATDQ
jgi:hypothetical protein